MKGSGLIGSMGFITGILFIILGAVFVAGGPLLTAPLNSMLEDSAGGLRTSSEAIRSVTEGVSNSSGMIEEVRISLVTSSEALEGTGDVIEQTVDILAETRIIMPLLAGDMASMPPMVRSLMPENNFDEIAERTENMAVLIGMLNTHLETLSADLGVTAGIIGDVAASVELLQEDLLSAEGSFSEAANKMEATASFIENGTYSTLIAGLLVGVGLLMVLTGLYHIISASAIRKLMKKQAA